MWCSPLLQPHLIETQILAVYKIFFLFCCQFLGNVSNSSSRFRGEAFRYSVGAILALWTDNSIHSLWNTSTNNTYCRFKTPLLCQGSRVFSSVCSKDIWKPVNSFQWILEKQRENLQSTAARMDISAIFSGPVTISLGKLWTVMQVNIWNIRNMAALQQYGRMCNAANRINSAVCPATCSDHCSLLVIN